MVVVPHTKEEILNILSVIADPEIPVITIQEMGMLRDVIVGPMGYEVIVTPTYTGCPAMGIIEADIKAELHAKGVAPVSVKMVYTPAWTTEWISDEVKKKMKDYGIAPPGKACNHVDIENPHCPLCNSTDTEMISRFGATACKALYKCKSCKEPFEYFKCH